MLVLIDLRYSTPVASEAASGGQQLDCVLGPSRAIPDDPIDQWENEGGRVLSGKARTHCAP